ncbi:MAG: hypothetical protein AUH33_05615 [Chloroflexi bacterium 13_1_40CM_68_21]|nr:MAG: hypothetical protein AUH33_05615 [Chloroflexi bacterium 13_1_40CM_68_21]
MEPLALLLVFIKASALSIGGLSSLPLLRADLVTPGIASDEQVVQAIAIGRLSTGPNGLYIVSLGYLVGGIAGAAMALVAAIIPPLVVVPVAALARLVATGLGIVNATGAPAWWQIAIAAIATVLTYRGTIHPAFVIAIGAATGLALGR